MCPGLHSGDATSDRHLGRSSSCAIVGGATGSLVKPSTVAQRHSRGGLRFRGGETGVHVGHVPGRVVGTVWWRRLVRGGTAASSSSWRRGAKQPGVNCEWRQDRGVVRRGV